MAKYTKPNYSEQWASAGNIVALIDYFIVKRKFLDKEVFMSAFLDETGTLITVDHSNPLPVALVAGFTSLNDGELKTASYANPLPVTIVTTDYTEAELPDADDVAVGTEVFNTTYQVKMRSNGTDWEYLGIATATLSALPLPSAVPSGTKFNITDLGTGSAVFTSNGTYWLPVGEVLLFVDNVGATLTTVTTETVLSTFTLNKKLASPNMTIVVNSVWSMNNSANIKTPVYDFGGVTGIEYVNPQIASNSSFQSECLIRFRNALNSQLGMSSTQWPAYSVAGGAGVTSSLDMVGNDAEIVLSGQLANAADNITLRAYTVTLRG